MSKARIVVTQAWVEVATSSAVFTVDVRGSGTLLFNEAADDNTAYSVFPELGEQFQQSSNVSTFVRTTGADWELIGDGGLI